jgi:hypothetical protein
VGIWCCLWGQLDAFWLSYFPIECKLFLSSSQLSLVHWLSLFQNFVSVLSSQVYALGGKRFTLILVGLWEEPELKAHFQYTSFFII